jgi:phosphate transport system protein
MEIEVEEECLKILALYQPVAVDLRFIVAVLKLNNDLERIGDLSVNIAERAQTLTQTPRTEFNVKLSTMAEKSRNMLKKSIDALVNMDADLAREVCVSDDEVDQLNRDIFATVKTGIGEFPAELDCFLHILSVSRQLERIGDHATNIAEDVLYLISGEIVRHRKE